MTILTRPTGALQTDRVRLSGTGATVVLQTDVNGAFVEEVYVVNSGSGTPAITIDAYDGTTAYVLLQEHPLTAKGGVDPNTNDPKSVYALQFSQQLKGNWSIRVTSSVGSNAVHVHTTYALPEQRR